MNICSAMVRRALINHGVLLRNLFAERISPDSVGAAGGNCTLVAI
jgi:hypothetical protein